MTSDEQAIRQLVTTWMEATKRGDTATVLSLMTDDAVFLIAGREPMFGKAAFAAALPSSTSSTKTRGTAAAGVSFVSAFCATCRRSGVK